MTLQLKLCHRDMEQLLLWAFLTQLFHQHPDNVVIFSGNKAEMIVRVHSFILLKVLVK